jgi:hypothetical protein
MLRTWIAALILAVGVLAFLLCRRERAPGPAADGPYGVTTSGLAMDAAFPATQTLKPRIELWYPAEPAFPDRLSNAQARWPLLLYFPGWPGAEIQNRLLLRHLVSRGFMVAAVSYPAAVSTLPALDFGSAAGIERSLPVFDRRVREAASDAARILDELGRLDALDQGWLSHRLDLAHDGILGFSWGGAVAVRAYWTDARLGSAVVLDEDRWLDVPQRPDRCRVLLLSDEPAADYENADADGRNLLRQLRSYGGTWLTLPGAVHEDFSDAVLTPPLRRRLFSRISPPRKLNIVETYVAEYLGAGLRGSSAATVPDPRRLFPEVKVTEFHGDTGCPAGR